MDDRFAGSKATTTVDVVAPRTEGSRLCQLATAASSLAIASHSVADHKAAADAHRKAFAAMRGSRPSAAQHHLRRLAEHDKIATEPESYEAKREAAYRADDEAEGSIGSEALRNAAKAHLAAAAAAEKKKNGPKATPNGGGPIDAWEVSMHKRRADDYGSQADILDEALKRVASSEPASAKE